MPLVSGSRLGAYEILDPLGAGGMGEVYRARDRRLDRDVALKILPDAFAGDRERFLRFEREAKVLASLNHPHIAQIYGLETTSLTGSADAAAAGPGVPAGYALVMELVAGPTLAERLVTGPLALDEALALARQIAEALEAAHAQGIVHRDLKPANVKVRDDGVVKVLDFGLAKALEPHAAAPGVSVSPTLSLHATQAGIILGTAAYMAPEQARGKPADTRADIWAFGVVVFEMLSGRRPFDGGDEVTDTLAAILKSEPAWDALPRGTPVALHRLLRRCLQKDRQQRLQHIGDARLEIDEARQPAAADAITSRRGPAWHYLAVAAAAAAVTLAVASLFAPRETETPVAPEMRLDVETPNTFASQFALSPDGRLLVYAGTPQTGGRLWVRSLVDGSLRSLAGTEGAEYPFWSPDSRALGFFAGNQLRRVNLEGGPSVRLAPALTPAGGSWGPDGWILFVPSDSGPVMRVSDRGGEVRRVTPERSPPLATRAPQFLPDGRRFLFFVARGGEPPGVYVGDLDSDRITRVVATDLPALYTSDHLWFVRDGILLAQAFNPATTELTGTPHRVADGVGRGLFSASMHASASGTVAFRTGVDPLSSRGLIWFDRRGTELGRAGDAGALGADPSISPDGRYVVMQRVLQENTDLWLLDLERNVFTRLTDQPGVDARPTWAPDSRRVVFTRLSEQATGLTILTIDRAAADELLPLGGDRTARIACDWSPDGRLILYKQFDATTGVSDLWALPMQGGGSPYPVIQTVHDERDGQFSPDGRWIAYESNESGRPEIYVQPFPGPGPKLRVSAAGGTQVRWRRDLGELFYVASDGILMAVDVDLTKVPPALGPPEPLFTTRIAPVRTTARQQYAVSSDGRRFLVSSVDQQELPPLTILLNWKPPDAGAR